MCVEIINTFQLDIYHLKITAFKDLPFAHKGTLISQFLNTFKSTYILNKLDIVEEETTHSRHPQTQKSDIQGMSDMTYHFQNCGIVNMDSFNARGVRMENCHNNVPVSCSFLPITFVFI
jgi:hypothetical protein